MQEQKKEKLSIEEWLNRLERDLEDLQRQYPNTIPKTFENGHSAVNGDNINNDNNAPQPPAPEKNATPFTFAEVYFQNTLGNYLCIIGILKPLAQNPIRTLLKIDEYMEGNHPEINRLLTAISAAGTFGLPHLFHPVVDENNETLEIRGDDRCYRLALIMQKHFLTLLKADTGILTTILNKVLTTFGEKDKGLVYYITQLLNELNGRIGKFQFNQQFRTMVSNYLDYARPLLNDSIDSLSDSDNVWTADHLSKLLSGFIDIVEDTSRRPSIIPQYVRDNPLCYFELRGFEGWGYPRLLRDFFSADPTPVMLWYYEEDSVKNIEMGETIAQKLTEIIEILDADYIEILTEHQIVDQYYHLKALVSALILRNTEINNNNGMLEDICSYPRTISENLDALIGVLKSHKDFDSQAWNIAFSHNAKQLNKMRKFSRHLFDKLREYQDIAHLNNEISGHARIYIFVDLLNNTIALVQDAKRIFEQNNLQKTDEYLALTRYLESIDFIVTLYNDCADNLRSPSAIKVVETINHSNN